MMTARSRSDFRCESGSDVFRLVTSLLVLSSVPADLNDGKQYDFYAGTSMAAPQVAGLVALVREVAPGLSAKKAQNVIERTARFSSGKSSPTIGAGVVYAPDAVAEAERFSK